MTLAPKKTDDPCGAGCPQCLLTGGNEGLTAWMTAHAEAATGGQNRGWRLVAPAAGAFIVPIAAALAGALLAGEGETRRFVGLAIGLLAGLAVCAAVARAFRPGRRPNKEPV